MIDGLRPYPEMKASGLPWLGDVPAHWDVLRSKYGFREVDRRSPTGEETHLSMSQRLGLVPAGQVTKSLVSESYVGAKLVEKDDLVLNRLKAHLGVFAYARQPGLISPDYTVLRPRPPASVRYFEYVLKSPACRAELRTRAKGIVEGFWRLYTDDFYDIRLPMPPLDEQRLIVRFLDWHGTQTTKLIRAKKKLVALLNEQKQAIIHRAVTRGLNPSVRLKPSGVEWLGEIPENWEVLPLRRRWEIVDCKHLTVPFVDEGLPLASVREVQKFDLDLAKAKRTRSDWFAHLIAQGRRPNKGDLIYCRNVSVGACSYVNTDEKFAMGQDVCLIRSTTQSGRYLNYFIHSPAMKMQLSALLIGSTFNRINVSAIKALLIAIPPLPEQEQIAFMLDRSLLQYEHPIAVAQQEISLIQEFRTRLIADVVTGKLDVRGLAASLPEIAEPDAEPVEDDDLDEAADDAEAEEIAA